MARDWLTPQLHINLYIGKYRMTNEYVYPCTEEKKNDHGYHYTENHLGLTKREHFALAIYCAQYNSNHSPSTEGAVHWADLLLRELNK